MRLTNRILEGIISAASYVEAGGIDEVQGLEGDEAEDMYNAIMDASDWAAEQIRKRKQKSQKTRS